MRRGIEAAKEVPMMNAPFSIKRMAAGLVAASVAVGALVMMAQPAEAGWRRGGYAPAYAGRG